MTGAAAEPERRVVVAADAGALTGVTAARIRRVLADAIAARGRAWIALSGGRTPRAVYQRLADGDAIAVDWARVHVAFGDERLVPPDHGDSNYRMARESLLDRVVIPPAQVHRIRGESPTAADAAAGYAAALTDAFALALGAWPVFDLLLLGIGADGHTASLFPGTPALDVRDRLVVEASAPSPPVARVSLTFPVLNAGRAVLILASGGDKAPAVARALADDGDVADCPIRGVRPAAGTVTWHLDADAASQLPTRPEALE